jgi:hypothetical protein
VARCGEKSSRADQRKLLQFAAGGGERRVGRERRISRGVGEAQKRGEDRRAQGNYIKMRKREGEFRQISAG